MALITWDPAAKGSSLTLSNGNLTVTSTGNASARGVRATAGKSVGKWYFEIFIGTNSYQLFGLATTAQSVSLDMSTITPINASSRLMEPYRGIYWGAGGANFTANTSANQNYGIALDLDNGTIKLYRQGNLVSTVFTGVTGLGTLYPFLGSAIVETANFGATPFDIVTRVPANWEALYADGYLPLDVENASWLFSIYYLVKTNNNKILTWNGATWVDTLLTPADLAVANPGYTTNFQTHGFEDLSIIDNTKIQALAALGYTSFSILRTEA